MDNNCQTTDGYCGNGVRACTLYRQQRSASGLEIAYIVLGISNNDSKSTISYYNSYFSALNAQSQHSFWLSSVHTHNLLHAQPW